MSEEWGGEQCGEGGGGVSEDWEAWQRGDRVETAQGLAYLVCV